MFLDTEGTTIQELAAVEINLETKMIMDVFHVYAYTAEEDNFARKHIHGLNLEYIKNHESIHCCESALILEFKRWLQQKENIMIFCNDAEKERKVLGLEMYDFKLLPWAERTHCVSHQIAIRFKKLSIPVLGQSCSNLAHSCFVSAPACRNVLIEEAKHCHGYHCALYDVLEMYYELVMTW